MNKHEKIKLTLKILGVSLLGIGAILTAIGFISFFSAMSSFGTPKYFWCAFLGLPLLAFGGAVTMMGFKSEVSRYMKNESVPVINEASEELSPAIRNVASTVKESLDTKQILCSCGKENDANSKYCSACGKPLFTVCPNCHKELEQDSAFCNACGQKL